MSIYQRTGIRPVIWAAFGAAVLASPFTQSGFRGFVENSVRRAYSLANPRRNESAVHYMMNCDITQREIDYVRQNPNFFPVRYYLLNPRFPKKDFMELARQNHNETFGWAMAIAIEQDPNYEFSEDDINFARDPRNLESPLTCSFVSHPNYPLNSEDLDAHKYSPRNSNFKKAIERHPGFKQVAQELILTTTSTTNSISTSY